MSVYALDFDGVVCDSCGESSRSAFYAAKEQWPEVMAAYDSMPTWLEEAMHEIRPVVETGYENLLLVRLLVEAHDAPTSSRSSEAQLVTELLRDFPSRKKAAMEEWSVSSEQLIETFGTVRDRWIENDLQGWLGANHFYPGVVHAINTATSPIFIITTKQARFAKALLEYAGVTNIDDEHIFGLGTGSKVSILKQLVRRPEFRGKTIHFVEDRLETLEGAVLSLLGSPIRFYLATWGYNTAKARKLAERDPQIELLELQQFEQKLQ